MNKLAVTLDQLRKGFQKIPLKRAVESSFGGAAADSNTIRKLNRAIIARDLHKTLSKLTPDKSVSAYSRVVDDAMELSERFEKSNKPVKQGIFFDQKQLNDNWDFDGSPRQQRVFNALIKKHEADELAVKRISSIRGHASPSVVLKEHNNLTRLEHPDKEEMQRLFLKARKRESRALNIPGYEHGKSERFSRHAIKRITEHYIRNKRPFTSFNVDDFYK